MKSFINLFGTSKPILLAPMFEVTNLPFRLFCRNIGSSGGIAEFISVNQLLHVYKNNLQSKNSLQYLMETDYKEKPVGMQLFGFEADHFNQLSQVFDFTTTGFDFLDLNIGCPVPKICNIGAGSKLLQNENLYKLEEILKTIKTSFPDIPFSIKIRAGYKYFLNLDSFSELVNSIDLLHVTIHPKLAVNPEKDKPNKPNHMISRELVEKVTHPVIINGGITSLKMAQELLKLTQAAGAMIGRQAQKFPWVFNENYQNSISTKKFIEDLFYFIELNKEYGYGKLYVVRDQILGMIRGFSGSKFKRSELQAKIDSLTPLEVYISRLEVYFDENGIEIIKNIPDNLKQATAVI